MTDKQLIQQPIQPRDWWLVFESDHSRALTVHPRRSPRWVRWWTSPGFRHVWAMAPATCTAGTITVQSLGRMLEVDWGPVDIDEAVAACRARGHRVVLVAGSVQQGYFPPVFSHCVTVTKSLLGIRAPSVLTPKQLWRYVHERGLVL